MVAKKSFTEADLIDSRDCNGLLRLLGLVSALASGDYCCCHNRWNSLGKSLFCNWQHFLVFNSPLVACDWSSHLFIGLFYINNWRSFCIQHIKLALIALVPIAMQVVPVRR